MDSSKKNLFSIFNLKKNFNLDKSNETSISSIVNTNNNLTTSSDTENDPSLLNNNYFSDTSKKQNDDVCVNFEVDDLGSIISGPS